MTARELLDVLKKIPKNKLDLKIVIIHGASGDSFGLEGFGDVREVEERNFEGEFSNMKFGDEYICGSI